MEKRLPLKKVSVSNEYYFSPGGGGGGPTVFGDVTPEVRGALGAQVHHVAEHFQTSFARYPRAAAVARVHLKTEAIAKSHRPTSLFENASCPIVGVGGLGELLVSVRPGTVEGLEQAVRFDGTKQAIANVSTIARVEPFQVDVAPVRALGSVLRESVRTPVKVRLFRHKDESINDVLQAAFLREVEALAIEVEELNYASSLTVFRLARVREEHLSRLAAFIGTQSLGAFPEYRIVRPAATPVGKLTPAVFPAPQVGTGYPVVGVIDSGVDPKNGLLTPWIVGRESFVPPDQQDCEHGTFVAGLIVHGRTLNHDDDRFPDTPCRVLDVQAIPGTGGIGEDELIAVVRQVVPKYPEIRVWNMSLGGSEPCSDHAFSDLGVALDEIQVAHDVTFVVPAGNYQNPPLRDWPPSQALGESDRICAPADSLRALTVGSVAHRDAPSSRVRATHPSPFSRRGPGPVYLPKPEISHFGGNCDARGRYAQTGVLSVDAAGNLAEDVGTSYAAPLAASVLAHVQATPVTPLTPLMAKALVVHSAVLADEGATSDEIRYRGYGVPSDPDDVLGCSEWQATLTFEFDLQAGVDLQLMPFPVPPSLRTSCERQALRGAIVATLVYEPPLDSTYGAEYCRTNVDVSLGTYVEVDGKRAQRRQVNPFPSGPSGVGAEKALVEHGFKWSPVKVYRRRMPKGVEGDMWRLAIAATDRSGVASAPVRVALVITVQDPDRRAPVYNDMVVMMNRLGYAAADVALRPRVRSRAA